MELNNVGIALAVLRISIIVTKQSIYIGVINMNVGNKLGRHDDPVHCCVIVLDQV